MATTHFKGNPVNTNGELPTSTIPNAAFVGTDLKEVHLEDYKGKKVILNIFPSIDTGVCAQSTRTFNERMNKAENTVTLCISKDLPFALNRFCAAEGLENVVPLSDFRGEFSKISGLEMTDGPLKGLLARAVIVLDENGNITHSELVEDITQEPNYDAALN